MLDEILEKVPPLRQEIPGPSREVDELSDGDVRRVLRRLAPLGDLNFYLNVGADHWSDDVPGNDDGGDLSVVEDPREPLRAGTYSGPPAGDAGASVGEGSEGPEAG